MESKNASRIEPGADRKAWLILGVFYVFNCCVIATSRQMEVSRLGEGDSASAIWMFEITSHVAAFIAAALIPVMLSRFPVSAANWLRRVPVYTVGFAAFSALHILLMVAMRSVLYPAIEGGSYNFGVLTLEPWVYEMRKDFLGFAMILTMFLTARYLAQMKLQADVAKQDARETGRVSLASGGRTIFLDAADILYVKAAGNYVEVFTVPKTHLVRMTMSSVQDLLDETGLHVRVHRSYIANKSAITSIAPDGSGEMLLALGEDIFLPLSRKYKTRVSQVVIAG